MTQTFAPHSFFTSPWRGEVGSQSELERGELSCELSPHPDAVRASTLPLQGGVGARHGEIA